MLLAKIWEMLDIVRVYTKKKGCPPDFSDPLILSNKRHGKTVKAAVLQIHKNMLKEFGGCMVWGKSVKHSPLRCGLDHILSDEDVIQIMKLHLKKK